MSIILKIKGSMKTEQQPPSLYSLTTMMAYLKGELNPESNQAVEALLATDSNYAEAMETLDRQHVHDPELAQENRLQFEKQLKEIDIKLGNPAIYDDPKALEKCLKNRDASKRKLQAAEAAWEQAQNELEKDQG